MSELTTCNYCNLRRYREQARKKGHRIVMRPSMFMRGVNVWSVPKGVKLPSVEQMIEPCKSHPNGNDAYARYHVAWFMALSRGCAC